MRGRSRPERSRRSWKGGGERAERAEGLGMYWGPGKGGSMRSGKGGWTGGGVRGWWG